MAEYFVGYAECTTRDIEHGSSSRAPSTRGGVALFSAVPYQIEKITLSRPHFDGGRHGGGNEGEELEIDVTAVARNDSRFVAF